MQNFVLEPPHKITKWITDRVLGKMILHGILWK